MSINYSVLADCCVRKFNELGLQFDFENNPHLQHPKSINDIYKNFVFHSQNRSRGCAINFFEDDRNLGDIIWDIIKKHQFNLDDNSDYMNLFNEFKDNAQVRKFFSSSKGKDIQFLELSKTCQDIQRYISGFESIKDFVDHHVFTTDAATNWGIIKTVSKEIYNMDVALILDFFKEQDRIIGRDYLIKPDVHVKRFLKRLYGEDLSDKELYAQLLKDYKNSDENTRQNMTPYKLDKYIYYIGKKRDQKEFAEFVDWIIECCDK